MVTTQLALSGCESEAFTELKVSASTAKNIVDALIRSFISTNHTS
jgi:hypothetical protein